MTEYVPLLSPKPLSEYTATDYHSYVASLYVAPPEPKPPVEYSVRLNDKGNPVITVRREPKWLTYPEAEQLAKEVSLPLQDFLAQVRKRKIELRRPVLLPLK